MKKKKPISMKEREFLNFIQEVFGSLDVDNILKRIAQAEKNILEKTIENNSGILCQFFNYVFKNRSDRAKIIEAFHYLLLSALTTSEPVIEFSDAAIEQIHSNFPAFNMDIKLKEQFYFDSVHLLYFGNHSGFLVSQFLLSYTNCLVFERGNLLYIEGFGVYKDIFFTAQINEDTTLRDLCNGNFERVSFEWKDPYTKTTIKIIPNNEWDNRMKDIMEEILRRLLFLLICKENSFLTDEVELVMRKKKTLFAPTLKCNRIECDVWPKNWIALSRCEKADILKNGIFPYFSFFTEDQFQHALHTKYPEDPVCPEEVSGFSKLFQRFSTAGLQKWINHGTIYSISEKPLMTLKDRYLSASNYYDWNMIIKSLPFKEFFIIDELNGETIFLQCFDDFIALKILQKTQFKVISLENCTNSIEKFPCLISLIHLYLYYKRKKEVVSKTATSNKPDQKSNEKHEKIREGIPIHLTIPHLYEITERSVRKIPENETVTRCGWVMPRHVRTAHMHHFWVGTGVDRHLEKRWLDDMVINKELEPTMTIHEIK